ncbi:RNA polymerase sigma factor [Microbacterium sp. NPDC057407]|uniref:RNA polymerase sigma factor n=1 Tax=Microbacterium sp. NPDC057407 TaxID=3346120 RepID=UPI0036720E39
MSGTTADEALAAAHAAYFGRLVGWLFRACGDLQLAEDAVAGAFVAAVPAWRFGSVPDVPEAWLRVAARNQLRTALGRRARAVLVDLDELAETEAEAPSASAVDDRLALLFVCAHPAIDPRMHAPLMLQTVLGVDAARIATIYLVPAATMGQRLSRAKAKIRDAGIRFRLPDDGELPARIGPIVQAVYGAYGLADPIGEIVAQRDVDLRHEAIRLAEVITEVLPDEPEGWGLLSLFLQTESRRAARVVDGMFVPLDRQDTALWSPALRQRADRCLRRALSLGRPGRFQLEAAISAAHSARADGVGVDRQAVVTLYRGLLEVAPSVGASIGAAGALLHAGDVDGAAAMLDALPADAVGAHQPYWICRAEVAAARGDRLAATAALDVAIGLTADPALRRYLLERRAG